MISRTLKCSMSQLFYSQVHFPPSKLVAPPPDLHKWHHCLPRCSGQNLLSCPRPFHKLSILPPKSPIPNPSTSLHLRRPDPGPKHQHLLPRLLQQPSSWSSCHHSSLHPNHLCKGGGSLKHNEDRVMPLLKTLRCLCMYSEEAPAPHARPTGPCPALQHLPPSLALHQKLPHSVPSTGQGLS